jgi:hypothetical protein
MKYYVSPRSTSTSNSGATNNTNPNQRNYPPPMMVETPAQPMLQQVPSSVKSSQSKHII